MLESSIMHGLTSLFLLNSFCAISRFHQVLLIPTSIRIPEILVAANLNLRCINVAHYFRGLNVEDAWLSCLFRLIDAVIVIIRDYVR
jgi:hypothetical protein